MAGNANVVTIEEIRKNEEVQAFISKANEFLSQLGYTEHGFRHASLVADIAGNVLERLQYPEQSIRLAGIAGYMHDIGNVIGRRDHGVASAILAHNILRNLGMPTEDIAEVMGAVGSHEEELGEPVSVVSAAVILADKSDVHKSRVRNPDPLKFDIHDRVNFASQYSFLRVDGEQKTISLEVEIDTKQSSVMEYFEIFLPRMIMSRRAAEFLGCRFHLIINKNRLF
ncbi:MAG: HD domain-containing protein [Chloroflexi bacterium]|nr:HD domain-containing protein [Chloroflexota bacterium]